jgi:pyrimidine/purine-5'-nucleotide nucleosidase
MNDATLSTPGASGGTVVEVHPKGALESLSQHEMDRLCAAAAGSRHELLRRCALAILNVGNETDDTREVMETYRDFDVQLVQEARGIKLALMNPPGSAFVDGEMIRGIRELLFAVVRDVVYLHSDVSAAGQFDLSNGQGVTNAIFHILRNAGVVRTGLEPNLVVCWGGHSIRREEYDYCKQTGYELGLRRLDVCTGCGAGAMKGPMKGATIGHAKQHIRTGRYIGLTEPGIIAAESPNPIVNELVILPDMEKRLEAFVRLAHAIVIFPGGVGTAEEILFLLGILLHPANRDIPVPLILTGPESSRAYLERIDAFIGATIGAEARQRYRIIIGDPGAVATAASAGVKKVREFRHASHDSYGFNWDLTIDPVFQQPFEATHESMASLNISRDQSVADRATNLRRAFSGVVSGNVRDDAMRAIEQRGPFEIRGEKALMQQLDTLLAAFVAQQRMRLPGRRYVPCYRVVV